MTEKRQRKNYSIEFKNDAVDYYLQKQCSISDAAAEFNITPGMMHKWIERYGTSCGGGRQVCPKLEQLSKEVARIKHDVDVLRSIVREKLSDRVISLPESDVVKNIPGD